MPTNIDKKLVSDNRYPSSSKAWMTVATLSIAYMFSIIDRSILYLLIDPIKEDLNISDTEVSILTGFAFAAVYAVMSIPMGRLSDVWSRKYVIMGGVFLWSILTMLSGYAKNFGQLFLARMGVGLGESALTPTAHALIADVFPPEKLARGMSVFVVGGLLGNGLALLAGAAVVGLVTKAGIVAIPFLGDFRPWQLVLLIVGFLSLTVLIPLAFLSEPPRHKYNSIESKCLGQRKFSDVLGYLWNERGYYIPFIIGFSLFAVAYIGTIAWLPSYFIRVHGWSAASAGSYLGLLSMAGMVTGGLATGFLSDYLYSRGDSAAPIKLMMIVGIALAVVQPLMIYSPMWANAVMVFISNAGVAAIITLKPTIMQLVAPSHMRGLIAAVALLSANFIGGGFGATSMAVFTDFVLGDPKGVGHSIAIVGAAGFLLGTFGVWLSYRRYINLLVRDPKDEILRTPFNKSPETVTD